MPVRTPVAALILTLTLGPAAAQDLPLDPFPRNDDAPSLMEEGAKLFFRGLMSEMEPAIEEMGRLADEIEPALRELGPALNDLAALAPAWRIWHPFNDPAIAKDAALRENLLTASDHFPVTLDLPI